MENLPTIEGISADAVVADSAAPESQTSEPPSQPSASDHADVTADIAAKEDPPLSKKALKKRRRWEKAQATKKRRKEQSREVRRLKAQKDGRDLDAEREAQLRNQQSGKGWARREEKWIEKTQKADIHNSFRVCFDCSFEEQMTFKECNSMGVQLQYTYAANRKSSMPVFIDVCGMKKSGATRAFLEKVEGFPERWVGRAFRCYDNVLEEVYAKSIGNEAEGATSTNGNNVVDETSKIVQQTEKSTVTSNDTGSRNNGTNETNSESGEQSSYPKLRTNHKFVYLTGDSPNTLTTLDNNTTYIIGGIVDRNRLKRATIDRAASISASHPSLNLTTARLPLTEHVDFKASTKVLTCNTVFELLQRFREGGYKDWKASIMAAVPDRKDLEEKG